ncbi:FtsX-like permease family protein [Streptomyces sp. NPDC085946]|uniref:FtsX-like permease family protein n=1 Tax=Streptomyces sp. NPDC085946 TaxID=3365744 RepID=UPI0037CFC10B
MTLTRIQLSGAVQRPGRLLLTGLAVAVAAFVVFATVLAHRTIERTILDTHRGTPSAADYVVGTLDAPVRTSALPCIRRVPGVAEAQARTTAFLELRRPAAANLSVTADPGAGLLSQVRLLEGRYPAAPDEIALTRRSALRLELGTGDTVTVRTGSHRLVTLRITGLAVATVDTPTMRGLGGEQAFAPDTTVTGLSEPDSYLGQIEVRLTDSADAPHIRARLESAAFAEGPGEQAAVVPAEQIREQEKRDIINSYGNLFSLVSVFLTVAVLAATLISTSTFRIVFAQRLRLLALLRAVGADREPLARALAVEGALTGAVAGLVGVGAAALAGNLLPGALTLFGVRFSAPGVPPAPAAAVILGAVAMAAAAALSPAASAARVSPLEALRTAATSAARQGIGRARAVFGCALAAVAVVLAVVAARQLPRPGHEDYHAQLVLLLIVFSGALAYFALVVLGPVLVRPLLNLVGRPLRKAGPLGRLAVEGVGAATRRAAAVSVVVALGVTMTGVVLVGAASMKVMAERNITATAPSDFWLNSAAFDPLPPKLVAEVRRAETLTRVLPQRSALVRIGDLREETQAVDLNLRKLSTWGKYRAHRGSLDALGPGRVALLGPTARDAGLDVGDTVTLTRGARTTDVEVVAVVEGAPLNAGVLTDPAELDRLGLPSGPTGLVADAAVAGEQGRADALKALRSVVGPQDEVYIEVIADGRDSETADLGIAVGGVLALIALTVLIAVTGVGSTTALSVVERVREAGLLRAVGLSRRGLTTALTLEATLYGIIGSAMGLLLAVPYSWLLVNATGANVPTEFPVLQLVGVVLVLAALTGLAGALPARRAARISPVTALAVDG